MPLCDRPTRTVALEFEVDTRCPFNNVLREQNIARNPGIERTPTLHRSVEPHEDVVNR
jgi:hypothetical protein